MLHIDNKSYKFTFLNNKDNYDLLSYNNSTKDVLINCYPVREYEAEKLIEILVQNNDLPSFIKEKICNEIYLEVCVTKK